MRKFLKLISVFAALSMLLCGCGDTTKNIDKNGSDVSTAEIISGNSSNAERESFKEVQNLADFKEVVQKFNIDLDLLKNNGKKACFLGLNEKYYYFYTYDDKNYYYFTINRKDDSMKSVFQVPQSNDIFFEDVYGDDLLVGYGDWGAYNTCHFHLISVTPDGKEKQLLRYDTSGYPTCSITGHYIVMNCVKAELIDSEKTAEKGNSKVIVIDFESGDKKEIITTNFQRDTPVYDGTIIPDSQGWSDGDGFCYEKVNLSNESYEDDNAGTCGVYYYSFADDTTKKLMDFPYKLLYIRGDKNCFVTSDYLLDSYDNSGRITLKENSTYHSYDIPGIVSGEDVKNSYKLSDKNILIYNHTHFWIYNLKDKTYYEEEFKYSNPPEDYVSLNMRADDNEFAYVQPDENAIVIHLFTSTDNK